VILLCCQFKVAFFHQQKRKVVVILRKFNAVLPIVGSFLRKVILDADGAP